MGYDKLKIITGEKKLMILKYKPIGVSLLTAISAVTFAFNCLAPDFSGYQKCSTAVAVCNLYCSGTGLVLCMQAAHDHNYPKEPCTS